MQTHIGSGEALPSDGVRYLSCMSHLYMSRHVCLVMYVSCMSHVCLMYVSCMSHLYMQTTSLLPRFVCIYNETYMPNIVRYLSCMSHLYMQTNLGSSDVLPLEGAMTRVTWFVHICDKHRKWRGAAFGGRIDMCRINYLFIYLFMYLCVV